MQKGSDCLEQVCTVFGADVLNSDGTLNRQLLAKRAFSTPENTAKLNNITHPWIFMQTLKIIDDIRKTEDNPLILFDAPVLLESKMDILCDYIVTVIAPVEIRKQRIISRDNLTTENAEIRIKAQKKDEFYTDSADFVIDGSMPLEEIYIEADKVLDSIIGGE